MSKTPGLPDKNGALSVNSREGTNSINGSGGAAVVALFDVSRCMSECCDRFRVAQYAESPRKQFMYVNDD